MGSAPANRWNVSDTVVDLVREPLPPRPLRIAAEPQDVIIDRSRTALVVVDMQNDFCSPGGYLDHRGVDYRLDRKPIEPIARLAPAVRAAGMRVIWLNWGVRADRLNTSPALLHAHAPDGRGPGLGEVIPGGAPILLEGSWGAQIVDELVPDAQDIHVRKYRYSGFWDTPLDTILRNLGVTTLLFAGVNADQCVMTTLQDAMFLGYDCVMLDDCVGTTSPEYCLQATFYNVKLLFGFVAGSNAVHRALADAPDAG